MTRRGQFYSGGAVALALLVGVLTLGVSPHEDTGEDSGIFRFVSFVEWASLSLVAYVLVVGAVEVVLRRHFKVAQAQGRASDTRPPP